MYGVILWRVGSAVRRSVATLQRRAMCSSGSAEVLFEERNRTGIITLNRPKQLNALTVAMVTAMHAQLIKWNSSVDMVIIKGAGDKAFCAGGDVVALTRRPAEVTDPTDPVGVTDPTDDNTVSLNSSSPAADFFRLEYQLDYLTGTLAVPYVALIGGITMGGGCGVSLHGKYRVCTEKTLLAMPETAIGLFPDVGGAYFLSRLPRSLGLFLALTGHRLKGLDVYHSSLATHCCRHSQLDTLLADLVEGGVAKLPAILNQYAEQYGVKESFSLSDHMTTIEHCFHCDSHTTVADIISRLQRANTAFSHQVISTLSSLSPMSLCVTLEQIRRASHLSLAECFSMDMRLALRFASDWDFYEGVRAMLVDKDRSPQWRPASLSNVSTTKIHHYFSPLPPDLELKLTH